MEAAVGLMCACFPIIGPLFSLTLEKLRSSSRGSHYLNYIGSIKNSHGSSWRSVGGANEDVDADNMPLKKVLAQQESQNQNSRNKLKDDNV